MLFNDMNWGINSPVLVHLMQRTQAILLSPKFEEEVKLLTFEYGHVERLEEKEIDFMDFDCDLGSSPEANSSFRDSCRGVSRNWKELGNTGMQGTWMHTRRVGRENSKRIKAAPTPSVMQSQSHSKAPLQHGRLDSLILLMFFSLPYEFTHF